MLDSRPPGTTKAGSARQVSFDRLNACLYLLPGFTTCITRRRRQGHHGRPPCPRRPHPHHVALVTTSGCHPMRTVEDSPVLGELSILRKPSKRQRPGAGVPRGPTSTQKARRTANFGPHSMMARRGYLLLPDPGSTIAPEIAGMTIFRTLSQRCVRSRSPYPGIYAEGVAALAAAPPLHPPVHA